MRLNDFTYSLPEQAIAQHPPAIRGTSKLLVLDRDSGFLQHLHYPDIEQFLKSGDVVVLNDTKVIKARLLARTKSGAARELLLLEKHGPTTNSKSQRVLYRGKLRKNEELTIHNAVITVEALYEGGLADISSTVSLLTLSQQYGSVPLPPYMKRDATENDIKRYQTVFAQKAGSVAAPTASLNFTDILKEHLIQKGVKVVYLTLHVGLGTFLPIRTDNIEEHSMHSEYYEIPKETIKAIQTAKQAGNKVLAVGTTVTRTLEHANEAVVNKIPAPISGEADIFIYPGYIFKVVDMLVTNFHAPKTTVLMLTAAFAGWDDLSAAYRKALEHDYQFLSYGDSMLIH